MCSFSYLQEQAKPINFFVFIRTAILMTHLVSMLVIVLKYQVMFKVKDNQSPTFSTIICCF